jgi:serine/threonine protein kinase
MLFGDLPFPQKDMPSLIKAIIFDEIDKFPSKIPVTLEVILHKALHKDPNKRYETVGEMLEEIQSPVFDYLMLMQRQESKRETEKPSQLKVDPDQQPRVLHYTFAHRFLSEIVARQPKLFVESLLKPKSNMINVRWVMNARNYSDKEFIPADGLCCFPIHFSENQYGVLIQLPQPTRMAEAYYVAVILKEDSSLVSYRYITLELTANSDGVAKTIIGEWNGGHKNYGTGPDPDPELFIEALRKLLVV